MSYHRPDPRTSNGRLHDTQNGDIPPRRMPARPRKKSVDGQDAYTYALRAAYLAYLLQPRVKRKKVVEKQAAKPTTSASVHDMMKDFSASRNAKSDKYPHDFVKALDKKLQAILTGAEKRPEYSDPNVKRSFAVFLNQLSEPSFRKQVEETKRAEALILMFYSKAVGELSRGKSPHDVSVKEMVDRHLALFVRLMGLVLKENRWAEERRDLAARLVTLEKKLYQHEENLATPSSEVTNHVIEEEVPLTYNVKDMPLVLEIGRIFCLRNTMLQSDIDNHRSQWTEEAALKDLKTYQTLLNVNSRLTLSEVDFETTEAYEDWKRAEAPDLSQMILTIVQTNPALARVSATNIPRLTSQRASIFADSVYAELSKAPSPSDDSYPHTMDLPDLNGLQLQSALGDSENEEHPFIFIPSDIRGIYRYIMNLAITSDLDSQLGANGAGLHVLSKQSTDLLNELALRWRLPKFSRIVLFLDCIREKFAEQMVTLEHLDAAFNYVKEPVVEDPKHRRSSLVMTSLLQDRFKWTTSDFSLMQRALVGIYDRLLKELYKALMTVYDNKQSPLLGMVLTIMDEHVRSDPSFHQDAVEFDDFRSQVSQGLGNKARDTYAEYVEKEIPSEQSTWEFYHIMQLGKKVLAQAQKIQKRYRKNPEILGISPLTILLEVMLPAYAEDSKAMIETVIVTVQAKGEEVPIQDGFDLYKELANFRRVYGDALPGQPFPYKVEDLLQEFVWRWITTTQEKIVGWVEEAIKQDQFQTRNEDKNRPPTEDERHSDSVLAVFRFYNQVVEQISQLEWDDDLTYAKFLTSLSKSLGEGIARYCEILDNLFQKEMVILTPQQEMAAVQTRQEKLLKYAKDTWNNDVKAEPFQFYPESFVKLNNIAFAIQKWDQLEQEMNVDACADVIKRHNPPMLGQKRKFVNFVFTVKLVEAEGLKACDVNGYSDPYVVLTDEYQNRLFKSKTIYRNLNPRWEETVDIATQGPLNVIATIWDWDTVGAGDYVGRTTLKLDPQHFGDFLPREYWLNLDTQGRILVRVSMEGERDDIQFYFGKAFRALQRAQRDMTRLITDKLSEHINNCLSRKKLQSLTTKSTVASLSSYVYRNRPQQAPTGSNEAEVLNALKPLFAYFDDNFFIMNQTLTPGAMIAVMTRLWKGVLSTIEALLVPALSDLPSQQKPLTQPELDIVFKWLQSLFEFFNAVDEETGVANGVPTNVLKNPKYHEIQTLNFFYFEPTENLIRTSERIASASAQSQQQQRSRLSAPPTVGRGTGAGMLSAGAGQGMKRAKSIMLARNLGTMRKAKEEKWKAAQAEPSDDMILRILRMRPEAAGYLRDRSRQKERLATVAAAKLIVQNSLIAEGGRMTGPSVIRR